VSEEILPMYWKPKIIPQRYDSVVMGCHISNLNFVKVL
jgi:hypothetical protein